MTRLHVIFSGMVQGVGFRYTTQNLANRLGLVGWVRNVRGGKVESIVEGPKVDIEKLLQGLNDHFGEYIKNVEKKYSNSINEFTSFDVTYTVG